MKKIIVSIISFTTSATVFAQDFSAQTTTAPQAPALSNIHHSLNDISPVSEFIPILAIGIIVMLIIQTTKFILDHKLKNKIINRGISEQLANSILEKTVADKKDETIKWAFLLLGLSGGLTITYYTAPLDIHSLAIIAFSIGVAFLSYYFFLKHSKK